jgi:hypothetical protein
LLNSWFSSTNPHQASMSYSQPSSNSTSKIDEDEVPSLQRPPSPPPHTTFEARGIHVWTILWSLSARDIDSPLTFAFRCRGSPWTRRTRYFNLLSSHERLDSNGSLGYQMNEHCHLIGPNILRTETKRLPSTRATVDEPCSVQL